MAQGNIEALQTRFLENLEDIGVTMKRSKDEVNDICEAVEDMLGLLLDHMEDREPRFTNLRSNVLKVGSFYGGTKINEPDEFDFLVVLDELPGDQVQLKSVCLSFPGFRHIFLKKGSELLDKWRSVTDEGKMVNRGDITVKEVEEMGDWHREGKTRRTIIGEGLIEVENGIRGLFYLCLHGSFDHVKKTGRIDKKSGFLDLQTYSRRIVRKGDSYGTEHRRQEIQQHGPATNINVRWTPKEGILSPLDITVDISPAFKSHCVDETIEMEFIPEEYFRLALTQQGSFLVIPTSFKCRSDGLCFNIAHTETEMKLVKDLSEAHRRCYKLLKYIMNGGTKETPDSLVESMHRDAFIYINREFGIQMFEIFSSFAIKTVVLQHSRGCKNEGGIAICVIQILEYIRNRLHLATKFNKFCVPIEVMNIFNKRQRIIPQKMNKEWIVVPYLRALEDVLILLHRGPYEISQFKPVNRGAVLNCIYQIDFSNKSWSKDLKRNLRNAKVYEVLCLPPASKESGSNTGDIHVIYSRK